MNVSLTDAHENLTDLVRRAEAGEDIVLTRDGQPAARIVLIPRIAAKTPEERRRVLEEVWAAGHAKRLAGEILYPEETAARSQDFLYDDDGLPG